MKKIFTYPFIVLILITVAGCATSITKLNTAGPHTYKINAVGASRGIQAPTINTAENLCRSMNKDYRFIRNIILPKSVLGMDMISYDLIFTCVEPGSPPSPPIPAPPLPTAKENLQETPYVPENLPDSGQEQPAVARPTKAKKIATIEAASRKIRKGGVTGDTPGEPESLGGPPPGKEPGLEKDEGDIIEEIITE